jgi:hypothetical protein
LKGEAKAGTYIGNGTLTDARSRLNKDGGWPSRFTIDFLSERLSLEGRVAEAERLYNERFVNRPQALQPGCSHLLFLLSPADPSGRVPAHAPAPAGTPQEQFGTVFLCTEYEQLRDRLFSRAIELVQHPNHADAD